MKILITGVHGFVGTHLVRVLKSRHAIYGVDIVTPEHDGVIATYSWDDLRAGRIPPADVMIHLAAIAHDIDGSISAEEYFGVNTGLTRDAYDAFLSSDATTFIFFSSIKAAAEKVSGDALTEDAAPHPAGLYGESKLKAEQYIASKWHAPGKRTYIVRPSMVHGPGNKGNLNLLYSVIRHGMPWPLGAFDNQRTFTSIDNLTFIIDRLIETSGAATGIYNICDDTAMSTTELIETMCSAIGRRAHVWKIPRRLMTLAASAGTLLHLPLNEKRLSKLTESFLVSNDKIKKALGVDTLPVTARDGIVKTIKSFSNSRKK